MRIFASFCARVSTSQRCRTTSRFQRLGEISDTARLLHDHTGKLRKFESRPGATRGPRPAARPCICTSWPGCTPAWGCQSSAGRPPACAASLKPGRNKNCESFLCAGRVKPSVNSNPVASSPVQSLAEGKQQGVETQPQTKFVMRSVTARPAFRAEERSAYTVLRSVRLVERCHGSSTQCNEALP